MREGHYLMIKGEIHQEDIYKCVCVPNNKVSHLVKQKLIRLITKNKLIKAVTNLHSILKSRDITLLTKVLWSKLWFFHYNVQM